MFVPFEFRITQPSPFSPKGVTIRHDRDNDRAKAYVEYYKEHEQEQNYCLIFTNYRMTELPEIPDSVRVLTLTSTHITSIPKLPTQLQILYANQTPLTQLPQLPPKLRKLHVNNTKLQELPDLPSSLEELYAFQTHLTKLPAKLPRLLRTIWIQNTPLTQLLNLPSELRELYVYNTHIASLPPLPDSLVVLAVHNTPLAQKRVDENNIDYINRLNYHFEKERAQSRMACVKEELMECAWHPSRVSKWLNLGEGVFEMMCGEDLTVV
jgi:hypothetical protein